MTLTPEQRVDWDAQTEQIRAGLELMQGITLPERIAIERHDDIETLVTALFALIMRMGLNEDTVNNVRIYLRTAYAFGKRDAQPIPDAFADALDDPAPSASATGGETEE